MREDYYRIALQKLSGFTDPAGWSNFADSLMQGAYEDDDMDAGMMDVFGQVDYNDYTVVNMGLALMQVVLLKAEEDRVIAPFSDTLDENTHIIHPFDSDGVDRQTDIQSAAVRVNLKKYGFEFVAGMNYSCNDSTNDPESADSVKELSAKLLRQYLCSNRVKVHNLQEVYRVMEEQYSIDFDLFCVSSPKYEGILREMQNRGLSTEDVPGFQELKSKMRSIGYPQEHFLCPWVEGDTLLNDDGTVYEYYMLYSLSSYAGGYYQVELSLPLTARFSAEQLLSLPKAAKLIRSCRKYLRERRKEAEVS